MHRLTRCKLLELNWIGLQMCGTLRAFTHHFTAYHSCATLASIPSSSAAQSPVTDAVDSQEAHGSLEDQSIIAESPSGSRDRGDEPRQPPVIWAASLANVSRQLTRQDIVDFFQGSELRTTEVRGQYNDKLEVQKYWMNFPSKKHRDIALKRRVAYLGARRAAVQPEMPNDFRRSIYNPMAMSSRGRYVRVSNLAEGITSDDVLRFFHGFHLHAKSVTFLRHSHGEKGTLGVAVVRFHSQEEAHRAIRTRQGDFCVNSQVQLQVLL